MPFVLIIFLPAASTGICVADYINPTSIQTSSDGFGNWNFEITASHPPQTWGVIYFIVIIKHLMPIVHQLMGASLLRQSSAAMNMWLRSISLPLIVSMRSHANSLKTALLSSLRMQRRSLMFMLTTLSWLRGLPSTCIVWVMLICNARSGVWKNYISSFVTMAGSMRQSHFTACK